MSWIRYPPMAVRPAKGLIGLSVHLGHVPLNHVASGRHKNGTRARAPKRREASLI